jgi:hypothetical protein
LTWLLAISTRELADAILYAKSQFILRDDAKVIFDDFVIGVFLIPILVGQLHIVAYALRKSSAFLRLFHFLSFLYQSDHILAIVAEFDPALGILQRLRLLDDLRLGSLGIWRVDIELKLADHKEVVPQLVAKVFDIAQVRIQLAHELDDLESGLVSPVAVFYLHTVVYYALDVPAVFGEGDFFSGGIIVHI